MPRSICVFVKVTKQRQCGFYTQGDYHMFQEMRELHNKTTEWSQQYITKF